MASRERLSSLEVVNWRGLATKPSEEVIDASQLREAINTDHFTEYGGVFKPPGSARVLSSIYKENGTAQDISWVGFYKASDLDGQILRESIVAAGTALHRIDSGSLTQLTGSGKPVSAARTAGLFHDYTVFNDLMLIQNQDPDLVGRGDIPVKYDGKDIQRWGLLAPGSEETIQESFASSSSFTTSGVTVANESTTTQDGDATLVNKTSTAQVNGDIEKSITQFSIDNTIPDRGRVFLYIPRGQIANFSQGSTPAAQVFIGTSLSTDYYRFDFDRGSLFEGWNELRLNFYNRLDNEPDAADQLDDPNVTIVGSPGTSNQSEIRLRINSSSASQTITGVIWDKLLTLDTGALTATEGASGNVFKTGSVYSYRVVYVNKYGHSSNAGPESAAIKLTDGRESIELSNIPVSSDPQVVAREIYRTVAGGEIHLFVDRIDNNSETTFSDKIADVAGTSGSLGSLGDTSAPLEGDISDDNSPPPQAGIVFKWKRTVFLAGLPDSPEIITYSEDDEPESYPTLNRTRLDAKITAIYETYSGLVVDTELGKWQVTGDNPDFRFDKIIENIGCVGRRAAGEARVSGYAVDREGMRLFDLNNPTKISEVIRDKFDEDFNKANIELMHTTHTKSRNGILMFVADSNGEYKGNNYLYQYPLDQLAAGWWWQIQLPSSINLLHIEEIEDSNGTFRLYAGGDDGMVYELFKSGEKNWALADGSTEAITLKAVTKTFRVGEAAATMEGYTGRGQPRLMEMRYTGDASSWTILVETLNGPHQTTAVDSKTITFSFAADETLQRVPIPMMQPGEYVRLTMQNSEQDVAGGITGVKLIYRVMPGQFPLETGQLRDTTP